MITKVEIGFAVDDGTEIFKVKEYFDDGTDPKEIIYRASPAGAALLYEYLHLARSPKVNWLGVALQKHQEFHDIHLKEQGLKNPKIKKIGDWDNVSEFDKRYALKEAKKAEMTASEVKERASKEIQEPDSFKPNHYHSQPFDSSLVQETIYYNIASSHLDTKGKKKNFRELHQELLLKAMWVSFAVKHLLRVGLKDDVDIELKKAENYLHKARTGEWLND